MKSKDLVKIPNLFLKLVKGKVILPEPMVANAYGKPIILKEVEPLNWLLYKKYIKMINGKYPSKFEFKIKGVATKVLKPSFKKSLDFQPVSLDSKEEKKLDDMENKNETFFYVALHMHTNDVAVAMCEIPKTSFLLSGSLGQLLTNPDMVLSDFVGLVNVDRADDESRKFSVNFTEYLLNNDISTLTFVEGNYNDSPNIPVTELFNSAYIAGKRTGKRIKLEISYWDPDNNKIETKRGKILSVDCKSSKEFAAELRDEIVSLHSEIIEMTNKKICRKDFFKPIASNVEQSELVYEDTSKDYYLEVRTREEARQHGVRILPDYYDDYILKKYPDQITGIDVLKDMSKVPVKYETLFLQRAMLNEKKRIEEYNKYNVSAAMFEKLFNKRVDAYEYNKFAHQYKQNSKRIMNIILDYYENNQELLDVIFYLQSIYGIHAAKKIKELNFIDNELDDFYDKFSIDVPDWVISELDYSIRIKEGLKDKACEELKIVQVDKNSFDYIKLEYQYRQNLKLLKNKLINHFKSESDKEHVAYLDDMIGIYGEEFVFVFAKKILPEDYNDLHIELPENITPWKKVRKLG